MAGSYQLWLTTDVGVRLAPLSTTLGFTASKVDGKLGWLNMRLPKTFNIDLIGPDKLIQLWRKPTGGVLSLWSVYLLRKWRFETRGSDELITIQGPDMKDLLRRRIVAAYATTAQATKTDYADDMMKEVVTESLADGVAPTPDAGTRVWANLSIEADTSLGPSITKSFPFDPLMTKSGGGVMPLLQKTAREAGTEVFFDIVPNIITSNSINFKFTTTINQPGADVSASVTFDQAQGNMNNPFLEYDYSEEVNYVYGTGQDVATNREVQQAYDATRYGISTWGRCEGEADSRNQNTPAGVLAAAHSALEEGRPIYRFGATPVDTKGTRFGIHWNFGYKVTAKYKNREFKAIVRSVVLGMNENGKETINARLEWEGAI